MARTTKEPERIFLHSGIFIGKKKLVPRAVELRDALVDSHYKKEMYLFKMVSMFRTTSMANYRTNSKTELYKGVLGCP